MGIKNEVFIAYESFLSKTKHPNLTKEKAFISGVKWMAEKCAEEINKFEFATTYPQESIVDRISQLAKELDR